jgi:DNA processing protein
VLKAPGGRGLAVLGCGPDRIYPPENRQLGEALAARGALLTEFPPGVPPLARNFPRRNRLISGLARTVVVVQAAAGSGSLITARLALDQGRDVFAVPGPITAESCRGSNDLIREGARPLATALEIVEEFPAAVRDLVARRLAVRQVGPPPDLSMVEKELWMELDPGEARGVDDLARATGLGVTELVAALLGLEIRGLARALPGPRYIRGGWTGGG